MFFLRSLDWFEVSIADSFHVKSGGGAFFSTLVGAVENFAMCRYLYGQLWFDREGRSAHGGVCKDWGHNLVEAGVEPWVKLEVVGAVMWKSLITGPALSQLISFHLDLGGTSVFEWSAGPGRKMRMEVLSDPEAGSLLCHIG